MARLQSLVGKAWSAVVSVVAATLERITAAWERLNYQDRIVTAVIAAIVAVLVGAVGLLINEIWTGNNPLDRLPWRPAEAQLYDDFGDGVLSDQWIPQDPWGFISEQSGFLDLAVATPVPEFRESRIVAPKDHGRIREIEFPITFVSGWVPADGDVEDPWAGGGLELVLASGEMLSVKTEVNLEYGPRLIASYCEKEHADPDVDPCDEIGTLDSDFGTRHDVRVVRTDTEVTFFAAEKEFGRYITESPIVAWHFLTYADAGTTVHSTVDDIWVKYGP